MRFYRPSRAIAIVLGLGVGSFGSRTVAAQQTPIFETTAPPGGNYADAGFTMWYPPNSGLLRGIVVLLSGSDGDYRPMVNDSAWQSFATQHHLALVGTMFSDKPHDQGFIDEYVEVSLGSGQALLTAIDSFAMKSKHPELATAGLLLWGLSGGGEYSYEFNAWRPDRVIAFIANKGGIYYSALVSTAARNVPGLLFIGDKDVEFRNQTIVGLFAVNRRAGALWAFVEEPETDHEVGRSRDLSMIFFHEVLSLRLGAQDPQGSPGTLKPIAIDSGFLGDLKTKEIESVKDYHREPSWFMPDSNGKQVPVYATVGDLRAPDYPTAWLPSLRVAEAWQAVVTGKPFKP